MKTSASELGRLFFSGTSVANLVSQVALLYMVITICYDVFMRYVMRDPTLWVLEINVFLLIFICIIPAADLLKSNSHIRVTFLIDKFPPVWRHRVEYLNIVAGILFSAALVWKGFDMAYMAFIYEERMSTPLGTPYCIPYSFIPLGFGMLLIGYLLQGVNLLGRNAINQAPQQNDQQVL